MSSKLRQWGHLHMYSVCNYNKKSGSRLHTAEWSNADKSYLIMTDLQRRKHFAPVSKSLLVFLDSAENWVHFQKAVLPTLENFIHESPAGKYSLFAKVSILIFIGKDWKEKTHWKAISKELHSSSKPPDGPDDVDLILYQIRLESASSAHATVLCLNHVLKTIEYIDSNGDTSFNKPDSFEVQAINHLLHLCTTMFPLYKVLSFADTCPRIDIQRFDQEDKSVESFGIQSSLPQYSDFRGTCFFWSLWFIYIRAQYPKELPKEILSRAFEEALRPDVRTLASADLGDVDSYGPTRMESFIIAFLRMLYVHSDFKVQFKIRNPDMVYYPSPVEVID